MTTLTAPISQPVASTDNAITAVRASMRPCWGASKRFRCPISQKPVASSSETGTIGVSMRLGTYSWGRTYRMTT